MSAWCYQWDGRVRNGSQSRAHPCWHRGATLRWRGSDRASLQPWRQPGAADTDQANVVICHLPKAAPRLEIKWGDSMQWRTLCILARENQRSDRLLVMADAFSTSGSQGRWGQHVFSLCGCGAQCTYTSCCPRKFFMLLFYVRCLVKFQKSFCP